MYMVYVTVYCTQCIPCTVQKEKRSVYSVQFRVWSVADFRVESVSPVPQDKAGLNSALGTDTIHFTGLN